MVNLTGCPDLRDNTAATDSRYPHQPFSAESTAYLHWHYPDLGRAQTQELGGTVSQAEMPLGAAPDRHAVVGLPQRSGPSAARCNPGVPTSCGIPAQPPRPPPRIPGPYRRPGTRCGWQRCSFFPSGLSPYPPSRYLGIPQGLQPVMEYRSIVLHRLVGVQHRRQHLVLHVNQRNCLFRNRDGDGRHRRHRVAPEQRLLPRQDPPGVENRSSRSSPLPGPLRRQTPRRNRQP